MVFLILAFIFDHGFFVTTEFIFGKGITLVAGRVCDENSNHEFTTNFNCFGKFVIMVPQCIYKWGHFDSFLSYPVGTQSWMGLDLYQPTVGNTWSNKKPSMQLGLFAWLPTVSYYGKFHHVLPGSHLSVCWRRCKLVLAKLTCLT